MYLSGNYMQDKAQAAALEQAVDHASANLKAFPRGAMGLTPDCVKETAEYRAARAAYALAFARYRAFNVLYVKHHKRALARERALQRANRQS